MEEHTLSDVLMYGHDLAWNIQVGIEGELPFSGNTRCLLSNMSEDIPADFVLSMSEIHDVIMNARAQVVRITADQLLAAFNYYCLNEDFLRFDSD